MSSGPTIDIHPDKMSRHSQSMSPGDLCQGSCCTSPPSLYPRNYYCPYPHIQGLWIMIMSIQKNLRKGPYMLPAQSCNTVWDGRDVYSYLNITQCICLLKHLVMPINVYTTLAETWIRPSQAGELGCLPQSYTEKILIYLTGIPICKGI